MFSCPTGQSPQLQHGGNNYNFNEPVNIQLIPSSQQPSCQLVEIKGKTTFSGTNYAADGTPIISNSTNNLLAYDYTPVVIFTRIITGANNSKGFHVVTRTNCYNPPRETIQAGGCCWASASASVHDLKMKIISSGQEIPIFDLVALSNDGIPLLSIPTSDPNYNLICVDNPNTNNCPPNTLDCGNGDCCPCDPIYNALSKARYELHLLKLRDELPTGEA